MTLQLRIQCGITTDKKFIKCGRLLSYSILDAKLFEDAATLFPGYFAMTQHFEFDFIFPRKSSPPFDQWIRASLVEYWSS